MIRTLTFAVTLAAAGLTASAASAQYNPRFDPNYQGRPGVYSGPAISGGGPVYAPPRRSYAPPRYGYDRGYAPPRAYYDRPRYRRPHYYGY